MAFDPATVIGRPVDVPATIGSFIDLDAKKLALQRSRDTYAADVAQRRAESARAGTEADVAARTATSRVDQQTSMTDESQSSATSARMKSAGDVNRAALDQLGALYNSKTTQEALKTKDPTRLVELQKQSDTDLHAAMLRAIDNGLPAGVAMARFGRLAQLPMEQRADQLGQIIRAGVGAAGQAGIANDAGIPVSSGQQTANIGRPLSGAPGEVMPGSAITQAPPPGSAMWQGGQQGMQDATATPLVPGQQPGGPPGATPALPHGGLQGDPLEIAAQIGQIPDPAMRAQALAQLRAQGVGTAGGQTAAPAQPGGPANAPAFRPTGAPAGYNEAVAGNVGIVNDDKAKTKLSNDSAASTIGMLQNVIKYTDDASVGFGEKQRSIASKIGQLFGIPEGTDAATASDLLKKNTAMVAALSGGNTDTERSIYMLMNPNVTMTPEAIKAASRQIIAQQQLNQYKADYFKDVQGAHQTDAYQQKLLNWSKLNNPVALQFDDMTLPEKQKLRAAMGGQQSEAWEKFKAQYDALKRLGYIK